MTPPEPAGLPRPPAAAPFRELLRVPTRLERRIARRYLRSRRRRRGASLSTTISIGGVAVGVMALIVVLGIMNGLRDDLRDRILVANPHLRILTFGNSLRMDDWTEALALVRSAPGVVAAAPEVISQSLILNTSGYPEAVNIFGIDTAAASLPVTSLPSVITQGNLAFEVTDTSVDGAILLGRRLSERLGALQGDIVQLVPPTAARINPALGYAMPRFWKFQVAGTFETGMFQYDNQFVVMERTTAQRFAGLDGAITGIQVRVRDPWAAPRIGEELQDRLGFTYRSVDWQQQNGSLFAALKLEKLAMGLVICFIMLVAAVNIVGTLTMVVADKTKEIGILEAMGLTAGAIGRIFLAQGAIIGAVGVSIGVAGGLAVAFIVDRSGWVRIDPSIYFIDRLPVHVEVTDLLVVVAIGLLLAVIATLHPSRAATRLTPVEAIRHE
ncbi:MAG TPA: ABC transporter permease [Gemmatimonadales bacterium]|nr:ABC transporter permease [Gemmatimonadales bacterium]